MKRVKYSLIFKIVTASMNLLAMDQESENNLKNKTSSVDQSNLVNILPAPDNYPPDCCVRTTENCYCDSKICCQKTARLFFKISNKISKFAFGCTGNAVNASQDCCDEN